MIQFMHKCTANAKEQRTKLIHFVRVRMVLTLPEDGGNGREQNGTDEPLGTINTLFFIWIEVHMFSL